MLDERSAKLVLWQGECGRWADIDPRRPQVPWNEPRQAKWLVRRAVNDLRMGMRLTCYFHAVDLMNYSHGGPTLNARIGLLRGEDCSPRLSYRGYQTLCTLLDDQVTLDSRLAPECHGTTDTTFRSAGFVRNGRPLYAWWSPVGLFEDFTPTKVTLRLPTLDTVTLDDPVLVDPLSQRVYRLPAGQTGDGLPLLDYPLLLTDRSVVPLQG